MERTIPTTESEEVELYQRTYYSLLRATTEVRIRTLEEIHASMNSLLHPNAKSLNPDMSAFIYSILRLPKCISFVKTVVLGQSREMFARFGYKEIDKWEEVNSVARRRRCYYDGKETLACFVASRSDIDDIVPLLTAYQIEWNKLHERLGVLLDAFSSEELCQEDINYSPLAEILAIPIEDLDRLYAIWDKDFGCHLEEIARSPYKDLKIRLLSGTLNEYRRATHIWWKNIVNHTPELEEKPVYFISSNNHSVINCLSGFALLHKEELIDFLKYPGNAGLLREWEDIRDKRVPTSDENFFYYVLKKYKQTAMGVHLIQRQKEYEKSLGITRVPSWHSFDVEAQIIDLSKLDPARFDSRIRMDGEDEIDSNALILNIDYPLGLAAYNILIEIASFVHSVLGVYIMGKAATLNGVVGDVMLSKVVHDEHSRTTFLFPNCFQVDDLSKYLIYGTVLDNQKTVTVKGTFLQNAKYMDVFYREGYTDIEMEAGPYLSAVYEMSRPIRHPINEIVNLYGVPFDLGIIHYASDTPLGKGRNLGAGSLSYYGMDPTYASTVAILRKILKREHERAAKVP